VGRSLSLDQAAEQLGVSRRTIYNRIREGRLQTIRTRGGSQRVLIESVLEMRCRQGEVSLSSKTSSESSDDSAAHEGTKTTDPTSPRDRDTVPKANWRV
jgi:excisionase family DNA binding protein